MIKFTNFSAGLFRVFVGNGNKGDGVTFQENISKHGRTRQTYVSKGKFRVVDINNNADYVIDGSLNQLSTKPEFDLPHLTPHTVSIIAIEDNSQFICVNYKNKKNVKEVLISETELLCDETINCYKNDFILVKTDGDFLINSNKNNNITYAHVTSNIVKITAISKIKVVRFYV